MYRTAPLPFMGQKRMFASKFIDVLRKFPATGTFVDLFGGSGLLSHITKRIRPDATVVYNDFDGYRTRLAHIPQTNRLIAALRTMADEAHVPRAGRIDGELRERMLLRIAGEERACGYVDYLTLSTSLLFSMNYVRDYDALCGEGFYNCIRREDYPVREDYLDGLDVVCYDYRELFKIYADCRDVVFLVDPPYLATEVSTYGISWTTADYLDVLTVLANHSYVYFTSCKSSIIEICEWMGRTPLRGNPFEGAVRTDFEAHVGHTARYTDIMLYKNIGRHVDDAGEQILIG
ncbi:MAG: DNA adenine methylase [Prevotella sp.]|nr:DNA adenine methylase [Prevotella sp.]